MKPALPSTIDSSSHPSHSPQPPGRHTGYPPQVRDLLCALIRETGRSESAAAAAAGIGPSSLSRWKQQHPELKLALLQALEEFRGAQLAIILQAARAEGSRGWRAAAWLLEHVFPEDYSPKAAEREKFRQLAARQEDDEPET